MWLKASLLGVVVGGSLAVPWLVWQGAEAQWRQRQAAAHQQAEQLATVRADNSRLSNQVLQAQSAPALSSEQERELLRLRSEVGRLRQTVREIERLQAPNLGPFAASNAAAGSAGLAAPPAGQTVLAFWPKAGLAPAGYADPTSALQTALWAMNQAEPEALAASITPEAKAILGRQDWPNHKSLPEELAERGKWIAEALGPASGFYVTGQDLRGQDRAILDVFFGGEGKTRKVELKNVGGQWKFNALGLGVSQEGVLDSSIWP